MGEIPVAVDIKIYPLISCTQVSNEHSQVAVYVENIKVDNYLKT